MAWDKGRQLWRVRLCRAGRCEGGEEEGTVLGDGSPEDEACKDEKMERDVCFWGCRRCEIRMIMRMMVMMFDDDGTESHQTLDHVLFYYTIVFPHLTK